MLLQQVRVIDPATNTDCHLDVWLEEGILRAMSPNLKVGTTPVLKADTWVLAPGLVDLYAHAGEPGFEQRETVASLAAAARAGGFTRVGILTQPPANQLTQLTYWRSRSAAWLPYAVLSESGLPELAELASEAAAFCQDSGLPSWTVLRHALNYVQPLQRTVLLWPQIASLAQDGVIYEGETAAALGLRTLPVAAETVAVAGIIEIVRQVATPVHLMRITQGHSLALIAAAQAQGLPLSASTTWQHLVLTEDAIASFDPHVRLAPPLVPPAERDALVAAVLAGNLSIATDHSPYTYEEKQVPFAAAPPGAIGLELALPVLWQTYVASGMWSGLSLWHALSQQPAKVLNLEPPSLRVGEPLEAVLFAPQDHWTVSAATLKSQSQATAWLGKTIEGKVIGSWQQGQWVGDTLE